MGDTPPSLDKLVLAYRQAKRATAHEQGAAALFELARFEVDLAERLRALQKKLRGGKWFSAIPVGDCLVVPKSSSGQGAAPGVHRIGLGHRTTQELSVRLSLRPTPEFATTEVLYLWEFGPALEAMIRPCAVGYRLSGVRAHGRMRTKSHDVYDYWPREFKRYREDPIATARPLLEAGVRVHIVSTDIASFFDSISPSFLLEEEFLTDLAAAASAANRPLSLRRFRIATLSLLGAYKRFAAKKHCFLDVPADPTLGVPIGSLTSRVVANVSLTALDESISNQPETLLYRRYVDDIVVVRQAPDQDPERNFGEDEILRATFPDVRLDDAWYSVSSATSRGRFYLSRHKTLIHDLHGIAGLDFLTAVQDSFSAVTSERRALWGDPGRLERDLETLELFADSTAEQSHIPRLRDADRFSLRRYMSGAFLRALERAAVLLDRSSAATYLETHTERLLSALGGDHPLEHLEVLLALLRVAQLGGSEIVRSRVSALLDDTILATVSSVPSFVWGLQRLRTRQARRAMRQYIEDRRRQSLASTYDYNGPDRLRIRDDARRLFDTGLRHLDREDDVLVFGTAGWRQRATQQKTNLRKRLEAVPSLGGRLRRIDEFIKLAARDDPSPWQPADAMMLLLTTRSPTYPDIARRYLEDLHRRDRPKEMPR